MSDNLFPVIDESVLDSLHDAIGDSLGQIVTLYIEDVPKTINEMRAALQAQDFTTIMRHAHSLKSSSANLGVMQLSSIATDLEQLLKDGETDAEILKDNIEMLSRYFDKAQSILKKFAS